MEAQESKMLVIGAGLPRTGTKSMKAALEKLLGGKCYHMEEYMFHGSMEDTKHMRKGMAGEATVEDWRDFFDKKEYRACVDYPTSYFYKDLVAAYPDAKVVLTVRDPEKWGESVRNTIYAGQLQMEEFPSSIVVAALGNTDKMNVARGLGFSRPDNFDMSMFEAAAAGKETSRRFFNKWKEEAMKVVPEDRLLVFQVAEGWAPLCKFLNTPIPDEPFPRVNDTEELRKVFAGFKRMGWMIVLGIPTLVGMATVAAAYFWFG